MRKAFLIFFVLSVFGCARVNLQTSKPIKLDISMRVDVYQHVVKDVESIQDQIYGKDEKKMNALFFLESVYAQDASSQLNSAIEGRKARKDKISGYFNKGYIGENNDAYLEIVAKDLPSEAKNEIETELKNENNDRDIIYQETAKKNGVNVSEVRRIFFDDDYKRASAGYWFEVYNKEQGRNVWVRK
jgi:uncharacterized protein YdbL (DUF1318 family)